VDDTLNSFRDSPLFKKDFPKVELSSINWRKEGDREEVHYIVYASPKTGESGGSSSDKPAGGKD
jgi:hypothetical protein